MTPLVPIFRAYLPEGWTRFLNIPLDGEPFVIPNPMSIVATALAMISHKDDCRPQVPTYLRDGTTKRICYFCAAYPLLRTLL